MNYRLLKERFEYHPDGYFIYKQSHIKSKIGKRVGTGKALDLKGYCHIRFDGKSYREHRLVYFYHHGYFPFQLDHINRVPNDNRIENLRAVTPQENSLNRLSTKNSKSKYKGVYLKKSGRWKGEVRIPLGPNQVTATKTYTTEREAALFVDRNMLEWYGDTYYAPNIRDIHLG